MNTITLTIEKDVFGGYGLGYAHDRVCFIQGAVAGEKVYAEIIKEKKGSIFGIADRIIVPSERRVQSECPVSQICGGCAYRHIDYAYELQIKKNIIIDSLTRIAKLPDESIPVIETISDNPLHYRSHAMVKNQHGSWGFFAGGTNDFVHLPPEGCLLLQDEINQFMNNTSIIENADEIKIAADSAGKIYYKPDDIIKEHIQGLIFARTPDLFFQANRFLRAVMVKKVFECAELSGDEVVCDAHCGTGLFSLPLAGLCTQIKAFDINKAAVSFAKRNAKVNAVKNIFFSRRASAEIHHQRDAADIVVLDPPRAGCDKKTRKTISAMSPEKIVYVSCNPSTFSRDLKDFTAEGYVLKKLIFIDMFPGTAHIELISQLQKEK